MNAKLAIGIAALAAIVAIPLAMATPGTGILGAPVLARATLGGDLMIQVKPSDASGLSWGGREWSASQVPEFLTMLRDQGGVQDVGAWVSNHPAAAAKLGLPAARKVAAADFAIQQVSIAPGGATGWHTHPGPALVLVKSGEFTLYQGDDASCRGTTYKGGQSFVDEGFGHVHIGRNEGAANVELYVVYLVPGPAGQAPRIDAAKPSASACSF